MSQGKPAARIQQVLCPTDLSDRSQTALGFAVRLAETLHASLTACHCAPANWFTAENRLPKEEHQRIKSAIKAQITTLRNRLEFLNETASGSLAPVAWYVLWPELIYHGVAEANAFVFDTTVVNIGGSGTINLKTEEMNLTLKPQPKDSGIGSLRTPLHIRGTFSGCRSPGRPSA